MATGISIWARLFFRNYFRTQWTNNSAYVYAFLLWFLRAAVDWSHACLKEGKLFCKTTDESKGKKCSFFEVN